MTIHYKRIEDLVAMFRLGRSELDPHENVLLSADRSDLADGGKMNALFEDVDRLLTERRVDKSAIYATKNIILELAGNAVLHGAPSASRPELLVLSEHGDLLRIWMFGYGRRGQIERLERIIKLVGEMAKPPMHREALLSRRSKSILARSHSEPSKDLGGSVGVMTIAALSSRPLLFLPHHMNGHSSFALQSTVSAHGV
ncbi:hypothetical protein [Methylosinus sp. KRF6]|uniref:hypothetical protein n=1 Tax=Methylosinus sp. KRF6 TaxID=2846853 RepID=UPI001C0CBE5E|nr:hypothetical protein [Methylosinus sp. KRF6]MBU3889304.1 hypothetical protein [Methylosinus sp. KRF6]